MRLSWLGLAIAGLLVCAVPGSAQQQRGDNEIELQGSLSLANSASQKSDSGSIDVKYGRFVTDYQQVGVEILTSVTGDPKLSGSVGPFYRYNFSKGKVVPYLGTGVVVNFGSGSTSGSLNLEGGIRMFLDRRTAFTISAENGYSFQSHGFNDRTTVLLGFSHLW